MGSGKNRKIENIDGTLYYMCSLCKQMKTADKFTKHKNMVDNIYYHCKECVNERNRNKTVGDTRLSDYGIESVRTQTITILKNMGYDIERDISEQFLNRVKERYGIDLS